MDNKEITQYWLHESSFYSIRTLCGITYHELQIKGNHYSVYNNSLIFTQRITNIIPSTKAIFWKHIQYHKTIHTTESPWQHFNPSTLRFLLQINTPDPPYIECVQSYSHTFVIRTEYSRYMESPEIIQEIPPLVLKSLGDRSYDKRKKAAFEIESIVHQMHVEYEN